MIITKHNYIPNIIPPPHAINSLLYSAFRITITIPITITIASKTIMVIAIRYHTPYYPYYYYYQRYIIDATYYYYYYFLNVEATFLFGT